MKNAYSFRCRISKKKILLILRCFSADLTAFKAAKLIVTMCNTIDRIYPGLSQRIHPAYEEQRTIFSVVGIDERLLYSRRVKGTRVHCAYGKTAVFGFFERGDRVYTKIAPDCPTTTFHGKIRGRLDPATVTTSSGWRGYNGLLNLGYEHFRVDHSKDKFACRLVHINGIEGVWGWSQLRLCSSKLYQYRHSIYTSKKLNVDTINGLLTNQSFCYYTLEKNHPAT